MNYSTPDCSTCSNNASTSSWIAPNPSHDNGSINAAHFQSALCVFFFDLAKHLHVAEKLIDSYRETKDGKTLNPESAEFISSFSKNQPLIDFSWEPSLIQTETEDLRTTYEKINSLLKTFKSYDPGAYAQFFINHLALIKHQKQRYASELRKHEGSDEDFFVSSARAIVKGSQLGQPIKEKLNSVFFQKYYEEEFSLEDNNCDHDFDAFLDDSGISDLLNDEFESLVCNASKLLKEELTLAFFQDLPVLLQTFSEKFFQPICSFLALSAAIKERQINKILPQSSIFSASANESNFVEDLNTLKNYFICKMQKEGKLDQNFSLDLNAAPIKTYQGTNEYEYLQDLLENECDGGYTMHLVERECERISSQLDIKIESENFKKEFKKIFETEDPNELFKVTPGHMSLKIKFKGCCELDPDTKKALNSLLNLGRDAVLPFMLSYLPSFKFIPLLVGNFIGETRFDLLDLFYLAEHREQSKALNPQMLSKALESENQLKKLAETSALMYKITQS